VTSQETESESKLKHTVNKAHGQCYFGQWEVQTLHTPKAQWWFCQTAPWARFGGFMWTRAT